MTSAATRMEELWRLTMSYRATCILTVFSLWLALGTGLQIVAGESFPYPGQTWDHRQPAEVGLAPQKLAALAELVGGRGCVVRHGYMAFTWGDQRKSSDVASAFKPVLTTLLFLAIQEGKLRDVEAKVVDYEPGLAKLNGAKDAGITWRHLASQTSGYGLIEPPGAAYSYNDYALALYYDTLTLKVYGTNGTSLLKTRLAEPLQFEDAFTFNAFGPDNHPGRLALSVRDFARFGLLYLRQGRWQDRQLLDRRFIELVLGPPLSPGTPVTRGQEAEMLPQQRSVGGTRNITPVGPGFYSFNWWCNHTNRLGHRLFADAPPDTFVAAGHGGMRMLWIIPSLDLVVSWNQSKIEDQDDSPENRNTKCNQAARLIREAVLDNHDPLERQAIVLGIDGHRFTVDGKPTFLLGVSYYGGLGASDAVLDRDLAEIQTNGFNWMRVWATWSAYNHDVSAVNAHGELREPYFSRLKHLLAHAQEHGLVVDITLSRGAGTPGSPGLPSQAAHNSTVSMLVNELRPFPNWYLDLANERNIRDKRFASIVELKELRALVRTLDPNRLVTASHGGDMTKEELKEYLQEARLDFISPHRPREPQSPSETGTKTREYLQWMTEVGITAPIHYQEPFRRGYDRWQPQAADYLADARNAKDAGAAGWCFHNGGEKGHADGRPRRSFDLRDSSLFEQLDEQERQALTALKDLFSARP